MSERSEEKRLFKLSLIFIKTKFETEKPDTSASSSQIKEIRNLKALLLETANAGTEFQQAYSALLQKNTLFRNK